MNRKVILIVGPTASGKTDISIQISKLYGGEIINADSMQIYDEMIIGTARPSEDEQKGITHHLFGFLSPDSVYNVSLYKNDALKVIDSLLEKNILPVVVGGTGLYINSLIYNLDFSSETDYSKRKELEDIYDSKNGPEELYRKLQKLDPRSAERIHINDRKRLVRRLEILSSTKYKSYNFYPEKTDYDFLIIGITKNRENLYRDIETRIDQMMSSGLEQEARSLYEKYGTDINAFAAIGYKEFIPYFKGNITLEEVVSDIKKNTRHFAKRQLTWFRKNQDIKWFNKDDYEDYQSFKSDIIALTDSFMNGVNINE